MLIFNFVFYVAEFPHFLFFLGGKHDNHAFPFEKGHLLHFSVVFEVIGKAQQQYLSLLFEENRTAFEKDISLYLGAFFEEAFGVFELEVVIVVVGLRPETDFLDNDFRRFGLLLFQPFLLLIEKLLVIDDPANRGNGIGRNLDQVETLFFGNAQSVVCGINSLFDIFSDKADFTRPYSFVDRILVYTVFFGGNVSLVIIPYFVVFLHSITIGLSYPRPLW